MINAAFGAEPVSSVSGNAPIQTNEYYAAASEALYIGQLVRLTGSSDSDGRAAVQALAAGSGTPVGIVRAIRRNVASLPDSQNYKKTADVVYVQVADDPDIEFLMQTSNGTLAVTDVGSNADIAVVAGSTLYGNDKSYLDVATVNTTSTLPVMIVGVEPKIGNSVGQYCIVRCRFNNHAKGNAGRTSI